MNQMNDTEQRFEAVVAVFPGRDSASGAVKALQRVGLEFLEADSIQVSHPNENTTELQNLFFGHSGHIESNDVVTGIAKGAAIGAATGALFLAVPTFGLAAPIGGLLGGALVGGMAGIDESLRETRLPDLNDYREMVGNGKTLLIIEGPESLRIQVARDLMILGAESVYQHPPCPPPFIAESKQNSNGSNRTSG